MSPKANQRCATCTRRSLGATLGHICRDCETYYRYCATCLATRKDGAK